MPTGGDTTPAMPPQVQRYERVALVAWDCRLAGGSGAEVLPRLLDPATADSLLQRDADGRWHGMIGDPTTARDPLELALACAQGPWAAVQAMGPWTRPPAWSCNLSKGDPWGFDPTRPERLVESLPGSLSAALARDLGVGIHRPGPVVAACSTGLYGLLAVADAIEWDQADHGLAGAVDGTLPPWLTAGFAQLGVLCGTRQPCSSVADSTAIGHEVGFAPASGVAMLALARRDAAGEGLAPAPRPWRLTAGVRLGDARHETLFSDPATLTTALEALWAVAPGPDAIVCHATGTAAGDAYERAGLDAGPWRGIPRWCWKPRIGHTLGASGVVELALALDAPVRRIWKLSLGFGGHLAGVAVER